MLFLRHTVAGAGLAIAGCYYASDPGAAPAGPISPVASDDLPCEVAELLSAHCWTCHADPPRGGAPMPLVGWDDLSSPFPAGGTDSLASRALDRLRATDRPMPPAGFPRPSAEAVDAFAAWVEQGTPPGSCDGVPPPNGGPFETTCSSGEFWPEEWQEESPDMNPGLACRGCHLVEKPRRAYFFMGTVFPTLHEQDRCYSDVPAGTRVEILDSSGRVALSLPVRPRGNFFSSSRDPELPLPFTARVVAPDGAVSQMSTPQTSGDCNACHTEQGDNGAPGRILLP